MSRGCWNISTRKKNKTGNEENGIVSMCMTQEDTDISHLNRDGSFAHGYGYPRVPHPKTMGMGETFYHFIPMSNGYPYPQNAWVGHGYEIIPMGYPEN